MASPIEHDSCATAELDIEPIVSRLMETYGSRYGLKRHLKTPPDADVDPIVIDEVHADPPGGRRAMPRQLVWCSECEQPKFWDGLAITNGLGDLFLIGETCGARFYGGDRLKTARHTWRAKRDHEQAYQRFAAAKALVPAALQSVSVAKGCSGVEQLYLHRRHLRDFDGDLVLRLRSNVMLNDGVVMVEDTITDTQGKSFVTKRRLGRLQGVALLREIKTERAAIDALENAGYAMQAIKEPEKASRSSLVAATTAFIDEVRRLEVVWSEAQAAHLFMNQKNVERLIDFARAAVSGRRIGGDAQALVSGPRTFAAFQALSFPDLALPSTDLLT